MIFLILLTMLSVGAVAYSPLLIKDQDSKDATSNIDSSLEKSLENLEKKLIKNKRV
jgi:hypothetical protein